MSWTTPELPRENNTHSLPPGWRMYRLFGLTLASDFAFANRLAPGAGIPDLTFTCVTKAPLRGGWEMAPPTYASPRRVPDGESLTTIHRLDGCDVLRFTRIADFYLWPDRIVCHLLDPNYDYLVEIRLLGTVLAYWLERRGTPTLHSAAVVVGGRAVAFLASNSGGKSSLAAALMGTGYPLLTDDILPIQSQGDEIIGQPGYPQMRMWPEEAEHFLGYYRTLEVVHPAYTKRRVPVGRAGLGDFCDRPQPLAILYLPERRNPDEQETTIELTPVPQSEAVFALLRNSFVASLVRALDSQRQRLDFFSQLVQRVPVRRMVYPSGFAHMPRVRQAILGDLANL